MYFADKESPEIWALFCVHFHIFLSLTKPIYMTFLPFFYRNIAHIYGVLRRRDKYMGGFKKDRLYICAYYIREGHISGQNY